VRFGFANRAVPRHLYAEAFTPDRTGDRFLMARPAATTGTVPLDVLTNSCRE
jgi:hypothetical protein